MQLTLRSAKQISIIIDKAPAFGRCFFFASTTDLDAVTLCFLTKSRWFALLSFMKELIFKD